MTREEFVEMLIANGWKMDAFGHWVKGGRTVRLVGDKVDFGKGFVKISDAKLSDDGKKIVWNGK